MTNQNDATWNDETGDYDYEQRQANLEDILLQLWEIDGIDEHQDLEVTCGTIGNIFRLSKQLFNSVDL